MSKIAEKIAKLIAKADSTSHPEEAETFMAKAHQLLQEHGMSLLDVGRLGQDDPLGKTDNFYRSNDQDRWRLRAGPILARYYGCRIVWYSDRRGNHSWVVYGRESARITFQLMWPPYVDRQVMALARQAVKRGVYPTVSKARHQIGYALARRISDLYLKDQKPVEAIGVNALVPVDLIDEMIGDVNVVKTKRVFYDSEAAELADKISLNRQTAAPKDSLRLQ